MMENIVGNHGLVGVVPKMQILSVRISHLHFDPLTRGDFRNAGKRFDVGEHHLLKTHPLKHRDIVGAATDNQDLPAYVDVTFADRITQHLGELRTLIWS